MHKEKGPLVGKRVVSLSLVPQRTVLGTIQAIEVFPTREYWQVLTDDGMIENAPAECFVVYDGPEFKTGAKVKYHLDEGGYWEAVVVCPQWTYDHLRYIIRITNNATAAVQTQIGRESARYPARLSLLS